MTPAERFVVVAGVSLLVFNLILFSLCLSLVFDSKAAKDDTAQLIAMTNRLLENQQATPLPQEARNNLETTTTPSSKGSDGCPLLRGTSPTTSEPEVPVTQEVTGVAQSTVVSNSEETSQEPSDDKTKIKSMEERINTLEKAMKDLMDVRVSHITISPTNLRRRRNEERASLLS